MTDSTTPQTRSKRFIAIGILSIVIGGTLLWISAYASARLVFFIGSERIAVPTISMLELPSHGVSVGGPSPSGGVSLARWLADQIESALYVMLLALHAIGGLLLIIGSIVLVTAITRFLR